MKVVEGGRRDYKSPGARQLGSDSVAQIVTSIHFLFEILGKL